MKKSEALKSAKNLLVKRGYIISGTTVFAPDAQHPLDAISIQGELSDIIYSENNAEYTFQLRYEGDKLKLINEQI